MPPRLPFQLASLLFACGLIASAHAAELGDAKVNSFIGQHLSADIELTALDDPATTVQVRLASLDVYRGANLDMPGVLANVNLSVMRRDGKQFLHVTSTRPVDADHLHLYLELVDGKRRGVRLATLWFAPDPTPTPLPERVPIPMTTPAAAATPSPARKTAPIKPLPPSSVPKEKVPAAPAAPLVRVASEPDIAPQQPEPVPAKPAPSQDQTARAAEPGQRSEKAAHAVAPVPPLPLGASQQARPAPLKLAKASAAPVCSKQPSEGESACVALDSKNAELRAEIGKLEARVNSLLAEQNSPRPAVSGAAPAAKPSLNPAAPPAPAVPKRPKPAGEARPAAKPPTGHAGAAKEGQSGMPWGWLAAAGTAIFAVVGALQFWRHRRKRTKSTTVHAPLPNDEESQAEPTLG